MKKRTALTEIELETIVGGKSFTEDITTIPGASFIFLTLGTIGINIIKLISKYKSETLGHALTLVFAPLSVIGGLLSMRASYNSLFGEKKNIIGSK